MKQAYKNIKDSYPNHSTFYCFELLIKGKKLKRKDILKWFNDLVDPEDWMDCGKVELINYLVEYSAGNLDHIKGVGEASRL